MALVTNRHSAFFAGLAAVGAFFIAYGIASGIGFDLWTSGRLVFRSGPPRLEPTLAVGAFFGAFVGFRLGGWRGALGAVLFALVGAVGVLQYFIPYVQCAKGEPVYCGYIADLDFVIPQLWLVPGLVLGVLTALALRPRIPFTTVLEAAGVFALAGPVRYLESVLPIYLPFMHGPDGGGLYLDAKIALGIVTTLAAALIASVYLVRRTTRPLGAGLLLALVLALLALPQLTYQLRFPANGLELIERLGFLFAAALIAVTAAVWDGWSARQRRLAAHLRLSRG